MRSSSVGARSGGLLLVGLCLILSATGCQVDVGGQTLPSPYYQSAQIQYYAPGPEFKLAKEAAQQKAFADEQVSETQ